VANGRNGVSRSEQTALRTLISYDQESNTIVVRAGADTTLAAVSVALKNPDALRELGAGEWLLGANLRVDAGAILSVAAPEVRWLKLRSDAQSFVWIKAVGGRLSFTGVCVTSWDMARERYDEDVADGRSFVLARSGARMDIRASELSHLGYDANESYGVAWRMAGTTGEVISSTFGGNFYGLYLYEASGVVIRGNEVHHSERYGIDPHTRSNGLLIEGNIAHHNGKHGIILAEDCDNSVVRNNTVYSNTLHGIVIYQGSRDNMVEGNRSFDNGLQGINVNDATHNVIRNNVVEGNAEAGIGLGQDANDNTITGNTVRGNQDGIYTYSAAQRNVIGGNQVSANRRYGIYIKSEGNRIVEGNEVFGNRVGVYLSVQNADGVLSPGNNIHDNREANVRLAGK
jgi:parallel beta-helix repeat protein